MAANGSNGAWVAPAFLRMAALYFVGGVLMGIVMGASENFTNMPVHAHINLLGWVSMSLFGLLYSRFPAMAAHPLARWHFWIYNIAVPVMLAALFIYLQGGSANKQVGAFLGICTMVVGLAVLLFALNVWLNVGRKPAPERTPEPAISL